MMSLAADQHHPSLTGRACRTDAFLKKVVENMIVISEANAESGRQGEDVQTQAG
jgi:hypothetical protein